MSDSQDLTGGGPGVLSLGVWLEVTMAPGTVSAPVPYAGLSLCVGGAGVTCPHFSLGPASSVCWVGMGVGVGEGLSFILLWHSRA